MQPPLKIRTRQYKCLVLKHSMHQEVLNWKKNRDEMPAEVYLQAVETINCYLRNFDIFTVPAPSFHFYENYPIWALAQQLAVDCDYEASILFPNKTGKTRMGWHGSIQKTVPTITCPAGKFVLIVDDILTTGHTGRISCQAVINAGSYPCFLALTEHK